MTTSGQPAAQADNGGTCDCDYVVVWINTLDNRYYRSFRTACSPQAAIISAQKERNEDYLLVDVRKLSDDTTPRR